MFAVIVAFLKTGLTSVFDLFSSAFTGFIGMIYVKTPAPALTELGELLLMGAVVGLAYMGIRFVRSMIPFVK